VDWVVVDMVDQAHQQLMELMQLVVEQGEDAIILATVVPE
jgi:hypothetical protein